MTRKRFIKLLMEIGYTRNEARECAEIVIRDNRICAKRNKVFNQRGVGTRFRPTTYARDYKIFYRFFRRE